MLRGLACVLICALGAATAGAETAGYVLAVQGRWTVQGQGAALTVGAPLASGALLHAPASVVGASITLVAARTGAILLARQCTDAQACRKPIAVPSAKEERPATGTWSALVDRVFAQLALQPDRYVTTLSRGPSGLDDAVLQWEQGRVDLGRLLGGWPEATYDVSLRPLHCRAGPDCPQAPIASRLVWSPARPQAQATEVPAPGLYELTVRRHRADAGALPPARCWVLLLPAAAQAAAGEQYRAALALVGQWGPRVDSAARLAFTRAMLFALADG